MNLEASTSVMFPFSRIRIFPLLSPACTTCVALCNFTYDGEYDRVPKQSLGAARCSVCTVRGPT